MMGMVAAGGGVADGIVMVLNVVDTGGVAIGGANDGGGMELAKTAVEIKGALPRTRACPYVSTGS